MPELPEVELARRQLRAWVGPIDAVVVDDPRSLREITPAAFVETLTSRALGAVERTGKHLLAQVGEHSWWIHLGMSGRLRRAATSEGMRWAVRSQGAWIGLVDPRVFGRTTAGERGWVERTAKLSSLGPDAMAIDPSALRDALGRTRRAVKVALMDQSLVAGLGNIQVAEALFRAGIHPTLPASTLDTAATSALWTAMRGTLDDTLRDLEDQVFGQVEDGAGGEVVYMSDREGTNPFAVYGREGAACPRCGEAIARIAQGGRSTFFCPACQAAP